MVFVIIDDSCINNNWIIHNILFRGIHYKYNITFNQFTNLYCILDIKKIKIKEMKKIVLFIVLAIIIANVNGQNLKDRTIFTQYILGVDNVKSIREKITEPSWKEYVSNVNGDSIIQLLYLLPSYGSATLLVINDTLYGLRFSPYDVKLYSDNLQLALKNNEISKETYDKKIKKLKSTNDGQKRFDSYIKYLNSRYKIVFNIQEWDNDFILIQYNGENDFFYHYDKELLKKTSTI